MGIFLIIVGFLVWVIGMMVSIGLYYKPFYYRVIAILVLCGGGGAMIGGGIGQF